MATSQHDEQGTAVPPTDTGAFRPPQERVGRPMDGAWLGVVFFAGAMAMISGLGNVINGLIAIFNDEYYVVTETGGLLVWDYTFWGWVHLVAGILLFTLGAALFLRPTPVVRIAAALLAGVNIITQLAFLGVHPVYSVVVIALDVAVIWGLLVHGRDIEGALS